MENLVRGKENKNEVLNRLNLKSETHKMSYVIINGIPHKPNSKGEIVPLKLDAIRYKSGKVIKVSEKHMNKNSYEQLLLAS